MTVFLKASKSVILKSRDNVSQFRQLYADVEACRTLVTRSGLVD